MAVKTNPGSHLTYAMNDNSPAEELGGLLTDGERDGFRDRIAFKDSSAHKWRDKLARATRKENPPWRQAERVLRSGFELFG